MGCNYCAKGGKHHAFGACIACAACLPREPVKHRDASFGGLITIQCSTLPKVECFWQKKDPLPCTSSQPYCIQHKRIHTLAVRVFLRKNQVQRCGQTNKCSAGPHLMVSVQVEGLALLAWVPRICRHMFLSSNDQSESWNAFGWESRANLEQGALVIIHSLC